MYLFAPTTTHYFYYCFTPPGLIIPGRALPPKRDFGATGESAASAAAAFAEATAMASPEGAFRCGEMEKSVSAETTSSRSRVSTFLNSGGEGRIRGRGGRGGVRDLKMEKKKGGCKKKKADVNKVNSQFV